MKLRELFDRATEALQEMLAAGRAKEDWNLVGKAVALIQKHVAVGVKAFGMDKEDQKEPENITKHPGWVRLRTKLIEAIRPFPEVRGAVVEAFSG